MSDGQNEELSPLLPPTIFEATMAHNTLDKAIGQDLFATEPLWLIVYPNPEPDPEIGDAISADVISMEDLLEFKLEDENGKPFTEKRFQEIHKDEEHGFLQWNTLTLVPIKPDVMFQQNMIATARDVLCWVLGHPGGKIFEENMAELIGMMGQEEQGGDEDG